MAIENGSQRHSHIAATLDGVAAIVRVKTEAVLLIPLRDVPQTSAETVRGTVENGHGIGRNYIMSFVPGLYRTDDNQEALATLKASGRLVQITRDVERVADARRERAERELREARRGSGVISAWSRNLWPSR